MNIPRIVGDGWVLHIEDGFIGWELSHPSGGVPNADAFRILAMASDEFPAKRIVDEYDGKHVVVWGTRFGPLYEDALAFLRKWGVKCEGVDIPEMQGERGPYDSANPGPAD